MTLRIRFAKICSNEVITQCKNFSCFIAKNPLCSCRCSARFIQVCFWKYFKGYLCYKMITSQNVSSEAQIKNFFIPQKNFVLFSRYSRFCIFNHPMIYRISDVTMSISHETGCIFEYIFWTTTHEVTKRSQLIDIRKGNNFQ